nr:integrase, catalytic region, zinc finger, CCHC-type, peptidase aspartic, catalytic [Tanacetum cinerariifolium]
MTLDEEISDLNKQLSMEKSTISFLLEEKKKLKSDFKIREDELLDKQILLEKKIKELDNILVKTGQSIQTIHMLSPKPDSFYHTEQKMALGYQNPFIPNKLSRNNRVCIMEKCYLKSMILLLCMIQKRHCNLLKKVANKSKFVGDFKSLAKEADESLAKHKALKLEIEHLLRAVVSQDIMSVVQNNSVGETSNFQTELERTKERFENCIIKKENEYAKLWNEWYKKCEEYKFDKISYDKAYNDVQQKIEWLQAQLGDLKGKSKDTSCVSDTLNPLSQKLKNENVKLEFQVLNYAKENAHLKTTYKNLFDSISVTQTQTKTTIDSLQNKLYDTVYENAKLRAQLFDKVSNQKDNTRGTIANSKFAKQSILGKPPKVGKTHALSKPVTSNSIPTPQESKVMKNIKVIAPGMFRINPFKPSREEKHVPDKVRASNVKSKVVCAMCKKCLITVNHDACLLNYVHGMTSRGKEQKANVSINEYQKKQKPKVKKTNKVGSIERLDSPKPSKPRSFLRWSPTRRLFDLKGKIIKSSESESQSDCSMGDNACTSNPLEPTNQTVSKFYFFFGRNDHIAAILGFGDLQWGNIFITRVYFVEGLGHNLFSVGEFCDSDLEEHLCPSCEQGKNKRASHPPKPVPNSRQRLHLLHMDLCGSMRITSINGKRVGISHQVSSVRTPQQNGVVKQRNRTLVEAARTMLIFSRAPLFLWAEAIATACFTQNYSIIHRRSNKTPYELINDRKPDISFLHVFGALCYPKNDYEDIGKLGAKGDIGFFIGYSADSCAYRVFNRRTKKIMETMNVTFDELSAMAFEQRSSKPGLQSMTYGQFSSGLDLTYAPSPITTQQPTKGELDLLFSTSDEDFPKKIFSNPLFDEEIIPMKIDQHSFNVESDLIGSMPNHDSLITISLKIDSLFDEFAGELTLLKSIPPGIDETDCHPKKETRFAKRLLYDNSSPRPPEEIVSDNSNADIESFSPSPTPNEDNGSHMEEIDLPFTPDDPMPPGIEDDDYDSGRDIPILKELLDNYSLSLPANESYHFDIPSPYRPPAKPQDCKHEL